MTPKERPSVVRPLDSLSPLAKIRFVRTALDAAAIAREEKGLRHEANALGALGDMLAEALKEIGA